jgi:hypothetical protein
MHADSITYLRASVVDFSCSPTVRPNVRVYFHGRKLEDHGGPPRKKIWRCARRAFTRFRSDSCFVGFYCPELIPAAAEFDVPSRLSAQAGNGHSSTTCGRRWPGLSPGHDGNGESRSTALGIMTPRRSSGHGAVFSGFLRGPPWASRFLRVKNLLACLLARPDPGPWISSLGSGSSTRSATTPGMGACRGLAS